MTDGLSSEDERALSACLGAAFESSAEPIPMAGCALSGWLRPASGEQLGAALGELSQRAIPVVIAGGRTRIEQGNPARGARLALSTEGLAGVDEFDAAEGVVRVGAGTRLADLAALVSAEGWELPLDPPGAGSTVGGALAAAASGPRRLGFGAPRDCVLGLDAVLASGAQTRCGGRVVKNVTGYDLAKLYVGSHGTLAVLAGAWLHLRPVPLAKRCLALRLSEGEAAHALALEAARLCSARAVTLVAAGLARRCAPLAAHVDDVADWLLVCELAGEPTTCERDARMLRGRAEGEEVGDEALSAVRELPAGASPSALRARLQVTSAALPELCGRLAALGAGLVVHPVPGTVHALFESSPSSAEAGPRAAQALAAMQEMQRRHAGELIVESWPEGAERPPEVFYGEMGEPGALPLMRAIKSRFDPGGILNPGRFVGGI